MSVDEMKKIVHERVNTLNEEQLKQVNLFIENINNAVVEPSIFLKTALQIMEDRKDVMQKLAQ